MKKKNHIPLIILVLLFALGLGLRLYQLNINTPPLYADETGQYQVYQNIFHHSSNFFETVINLSFTCTWFLGLNPLGVRLASALYGTILIVLFYFLGSTLSRGNQKVSLVYAALATILPWSFMISRLGHTHIPIMLIFVFLHLIFFSKAKKLGDYILSFIFIIIATIYYPSVIIFFLLFISYLSLKAFFVLPRKYQLWTLISIFLITVFLGGFLSQRIGLFSKAGRGLDLAIWRDINTTWETNLYRSLSWNSSPSFFSFGLAPEQLANKLFYNRYLANLSVFVHNYLSFFSPEWLFLKGDPVLRHSTGQMGAFYPFLIPFMLNGAFIFFRNSPQKTKQIFIVWILASPITAAITKDGAGYLLRVVTLLPFLTYFCALGIVESFNLIRKNWQIPYGAALSFIGLYSAYYFFFGYFHVYPSLSARSFEYGFKELSDYQVAQANAPLLVIWDGYYHNNDFRFWQNTPYDQFKAFKLKEVVIGESHFYQTFTNLYFVKPQSVKDLQEFVKTNHPSFIVLPDRYFVNYPPELDKIYSSPSAVIKYPDQTPALKIFKL